jgi:hypothetical protein
MNFITSKKGFLTIAMSVFFIIVITVTVLIINSGDSSKEGSGTDNNVSNLVAEKSDDKPTASPADKPAGSPVDKPDGSPADKPAVSPADKPDGSPFDEPAGGDGINTDEPVPEPGKGSSDSESGVDEENHLSDSDLDINDENPADAVPIAAPINTLTVKSYDPYRCGPKYAPESMICGAIDVIGIKNIKRKSWFSSETSESIKNMRIFYALKEDEKRTEMIGKLDETLTTAFDLDSFTDERLISTDAGIITEVKLDERDITPSISEALERIKRCGFIPFYNDFVSRKSSESEWENKDFFVAVPIDATVKPEYDLYSTSLINIEESESNPSATVSEAKIFSNDVVKGSLFRTIYRTSVKQISNVFRIKDQSAISIQFTPTDGIDHTGQFNSFKKYIAIWDASTRITYDNLNVVIHYEWNDVDSVTILDNILKSGTEAEFNRQYGTGFYTYRPFSILLIGSEEQLDKFKALIKN